MASYSFPCVLREGIVRFLSRQLLPVLSQCVGEVVDRVYKQGCGSESFLGAYPRVCQRECMEVQVVLDVAPEELSAKLFGDKASAVMFDLIFRPSLVAD